MIYGLEFPWSEELLYDFGAKWLTKAFHAAGTLSSDNAVKAIKKVKRFDSGSNGHKLFIDVEYKLAGGGNHTELFAKVPYPMDDIVGSDRLSSSLYKQPQDLSEINVYRLLESTLSFKIPKYYYGDVSNETTNFILITERTDFKDTLHA